MELASRPAIPQQDLEDQHLIKMGAFLAFSAYYVFRSISYYCNTKKNHSAFGICREALLLIYFTKPLLICDTSKHFLSESMS